MTQPLSEITKYRIGGTHRAHVIATIHAYAEWLAQHPEVPLPTQIKGSTHFRDEDVTREETIEIVRDFARRHDATRHTSGTVGWATLTLTDFPIRTEHTVFVGGKVLPCEPWL